MPPNPRLALLALVLLPGAAHAQLIHSNGFAGKSVAWTRGEDVVRGVEKAHALTEQFAHSLPGCEHIRFESPGAVAEPAYSHYEYAVGQAPVTEDLSANVWVKATRAGVELKARMVLPRERDPKRPTEPLTVLLPGARYRQVGFWQRLDIPRPTKLLRDQAALLRAQLGREVNLEEAFVDKLVLNVYAGPGETDIYIDDLEVGPVRPSAPPPMAVVGPNPTPAPAPGMAAAAPVANVPRTERGVLVELKRDRLEVGGEPFFFRAIRYSDTPLKALRDAGFNTVWFDADASEPALEEAVRHGFWVVPSLPLIGETAVARRDAEGPAAGTLTGRGTPALATARTPEALGVAINRFLSADSVLFWDLGRGRSREQIELVGRTASAVRAVDPRRPRGADIWDGFGGYWNHVDLVGTHRWPLGTSLEMSGYRDWLNQRRLLTAPGTFFWTWVQTHLPEGQSKLMYDRGSAQGYSEPVGPLPEQIRLMTYVALAAGCKGLGFWSDRFLADSHQGRDRLLELAMLNQEIRMLEPLLLNVSDPPVWLETSHPLVMAALIRSEKGTLVLPIWMGDGSQFVPAQGAVRDLRISVPMVPSSAQPWEIGPGRVRSLQQQVTRVLGATEVVLPEFDLTAAIVFTSDMGPDGLVVRWQDHARRAGTIAAQWAMDLADTQIRKIDAIQAQLAGVAPPVPDAPQLLEKARTLHAEALLAERNGDSQGAYLQARRALRPLRILMRAHWENAVKGMDTPTGTPYSSSFYTLPRHWAMRQEVQATPVGLSVLRNGDFDTPQAREPEFQRVGHTTFSTTVMPGWTVQQDSLDDLNLRVSLVSPKDVPNLTLPVPKKPKDPYRPSDESRIPDPVASKPRPRLGNAVLKLQAKPKPPPKGATKIPPLPRALERSFVSVTSPWVRLPPGSLVRISGWVAVPGVMSSPDGAMVFDSVGGEALGLRLSYCDWKPFHLYRRVPESGTVSMTVMLTGMGSAYFDDLRIEPMDGSTPAVVPAAARATPYGTP